MTNMANLKVPPHNEEAEASVLGSLLIDKDAIITVSQVIKPSDFYNTTNALLYDAMLSLYEDRKPIDMVTLTTLLKKKKIYDKIGASFITQLVDSVPTAANIEEYCGIIKEQSTKRALIDAAARIAEYGFSDEVEIAETINQTESLIFSISQGHTKKGFEPLKNALAESFDRLDKLHKEGGGLRGLKTGFSDVDRMLSGMQDSNLIILAARPGQGKTAMAVNIAQFVGVSEKLPVGIFSLEMSKEELVDRLLVAQADVDAWRLKTGKLSDEDFSKSLSDAMGQLGQAPIFIDDTPGSTISEIRTKARRLQMEHGTRLFVVDYLQLVNPGKRLESRVQEVAVISQALKNLARELKVPVLALSQLSRAVEHRGEKKPQLADLRESGTIEQDADVVMFLYRPDDDTTGQHTIATKLLIAKHRNGPTGEVDLLFRGDRIRFYSVEKIHDTNN